MRATEQLKTGRYRSTGEVVRAELRLLEESETRLSTLQKLLKEGEESGFEDYSYDAFISELDNEDASCFVATSLPQLRSETKVSDPLILPQSDRLTDSVILTQTERTSPAADQHNG